MAAGSLSPVLNHLRKLADDVENADSDDGRLLERFVVGGDQSAFEALVRRHGPAVLALCRRVLHDGHAAEDVFQAAFLVLARRAPALDRRGSLSGWLYTVANRLARRARADIRRRQTREAAAPAPPSVDPLTDLSAREFCSLLDEELSRLSEKYRTPLLLCCLEGKTRDEAARRLGWTVGQVKSRLERGRTLLRDRLARRGVALSAALLTAEVTREAASAAVAPWVAATARAAVAFRAGQRVGSGLSPAAVALADGLSRGAFFLKSKTLAVLIFVGLLAGAGVAAVSMRGADVPSPQAVALPADDPKPSRTDALGDPLPPGVLLRLGTVRLRNGGSPHALTFFPDGKTLLSGGDRAISLWSPATGKELRALEIGKQGVTTLALSSDGKTVAAALADGGVVLLEVASGKEVRRLAGEDRVFAVAFSPRGDVVAGGGLRDYQKSSPRLRVWDVGTGKERLSLDVGTIGVRRVAFSPDGTTLAVASGEKAARLVRVADGVEVRRLDGPEGALNAVAFSPDGTTLATGADDGARLWNALTGAELRTLKGHQGAVNALAFAPDGKTVATGGRDHTVRVWDAATGAELKRLHAHPDTVLSLAFAPDGKVLASGSAEEAIHLWDVVTGKPIVVGAGHEERVPSVAFSRDGRTVVTAAWDGTARLWDATTGREAKRFPATSPDEKRAPWQEPERLGSAVLSPDGRLLAVGRGDEQVFLLDADKGQVVHRFPGGGAAFSPDGRLIAVAGRGTEINDANSGVVRLYDPETGKVVRELRGHRSMIGALAFSADGKTLTTRWSGPGFGARIAGDPGNQEDRPLRVWDVATGKERRVPAARAKVDSVNASPDGKTLVKVAFLEKGVSLWEAATGQKRAELKGHEEMVFRVSFAPDGRTLATASMDGTVRLWDLPSAREVARLEGHRGWVLGVAFSPDGHKLVTSSLDTTALIWDVKDIVTRKTAFVDAPAAEVEALWKQLAGEAGEAYRALARLTEAKSGVAFLRDRLRLAAVVDPARVARLIADLDSDAFDVREQAVKELEKVADRVEVKLREALRGTPSPERRRRIEAVLEKYEIGNPSSEELQSLRALEMLERVGTPEAREVLEKLAKGAPGARLTEEAKAVMGRFGQPRRGGGS